MEGSEAWVVACKRPSLMWPVSLFRQARGSGSAVTPGLVGPKASKSGGKTEVNGVDQWKENERFYSAG